MESVQSFFSAGASAIALLIEGIAVIVIAVGSFRTAFALIPALVRNGPVADRKRIWIDYAMWLIIGLEFELAADIIRSVVAPSWQDIAQLAAIAAIRTLLNYFLGRDIAEFQDAAPESE